jgi:hypothetical protein
MMMTNEDRKKIFWLLKKYSSYTAWEAFGNAFQEFTDAWEFAVRKVLPPLDSDDMWVEALTKYWKGCEGFDKGLALLKQGDRYIFRDKGNWLIYEELDYARRLMNSDEYVHDWMVNKTEIYDAYARTMSMMFLFRATEIGDPTMRAQLNTERIFSDDWLPNANQVHFNYPPKLPDVPEPSITTIDNGKEVPIDGIWEPEWPDPTVNTGVVSNIRSLFSPSLPINVQKGCMNYLLAGTIAPPYQEGEKKPVMPVRWRLIWEDNRYKDGTIPAEEAEYFAPQANNKNVYTIGRIEGGQACTQAGYWFTPAQINSRRYFKEGEIMPVFDSNYGSTIWQLDSNQEMPKQ